MIDEATTRPSLLVRLRDLTDQVAWSEFVELYSHLIYDYARHKSLQDADASDVVQDVMQSVARALPKFHYDPQSGSFRGWLYTVTLNAIRMRARKEKRHVRGSGETRSIQLLQEQPGDEDIDEHWNRQHQVRLFQWASTQVKAKVQANTWSAFEMTVIDGIPCEEVARNLNMKLGAVYLAKSRIVSRIREIVQREELQ